MNNPLKRKASRKSRSLSPKLRRPKLAQNLNVEDEVPSVSYTTESMDASMQLKSPSLARRVAELGRDPERCFPSEEMDYEEESDEPKKVRCYSVPHSVSFKQSKSAQELPEADYLYIKKRTNFPDIIINRWYNLVKVHASSGSNGVYYEKHRKEYPASIHLLCIADGDILSQLETVYEKGHTLMAEYISFYKDYDACMSFKKFMKAVNYVSKATNELDLKLDLMQFMCRDIRDKAARVHKNKLLPILTAAGHLTEKQQRLVRKDIDDIFQSMSRHMSEPGVLEPVHFRRGMRNGKGDVYGDQSAAGNHVLTCVPEVIAAILAIGNRLYSKDKDLPMASLNAIHSEEVYLEEQRAIAKVPSKTSLAVSILSPATEGALADHSESRKSSKKFEVKVEAQTSKGTEQLK